MWTDLAATEAQNASRLGRLLVLAIFIGLAWLVTSIARHRRHSHRLAITLLAWAFLAGIVAYIRTVRPVERWSIWAIAALGYGILLIWTTGGGSDPKPD